MPRFSANISMLFAERGWLDRPAAAAAAGFGAVEIQFPYDRPAADWQRAIEAAGLAVSVVNVPVGDMLDGGPGLAATPGRQAAFRRAAETARDVAAALRPRNVNVLAGFPELHGFARERCLATLAENLRVAADLLGGIGVGVVVEAVNTVDRPGFLLSTSAQALEADILFAVEKSAFIFTDEHRGYLNLNEWYKHETVRHKRGEWVRDHVTTHSIESVWAILKRSHKGIYHQWSRKHGGRYANEVAYRLTESRMSVPIVTRVRKLTQKSFEVQLTYKELTR